MRQLVRETNDQGSEDEQSQHTEGLPEVHVQIVYTRMVQGVGQQEGQRSAEGIRDHHRDVGAHVGVTPDVAVHLERKTSRHNDG